MSTYIGSTRNSLSVQISGEDKVRALSTRYNLLPEQVQKASVRAINRALSSVRTLGARIARETYTAPTRELTQNIRVKNAKANDAAGQITFYGYRGVSLHLFQPRPKTQPNYKGVNPKKRNPRAGVSTKIKSQGTRKVKLGPNGEKPFWATMKSGHRALFYRTTNKPNPIQKLFGPSPITALLNKDAQSRLQDRADSVFSNRLKHEIKRLMEKM